MQAIPLRRYVLFFGIAISGCAVDLISKSWIFDRLGMPHESGSEWLVGDVFGFTTSLNEGALFGFGQGQVTLFATLSILAAVGIMYWLFVAKAATDVLLTAALGCVMGGIFGNLYDRVGLPGLRWNYSNPPLHEIGQPVYAVRDWLHFRIENLIDWPIFNIADSLLVCGAALLIWHALRSESVSATTASGATAGATAA